ncbi:MAG: hypothetical protein HYS12_12065 [Planctomycetes bacterium]|nr:hypothetical protein [Planctomycetota bacterium]
MEHLVFLLIEFILWLDRRSLKQLSKAVANLSELRARPVAVLAEGDVPIGPYRRWGTATALGLVVALVLLGLGSVVLLAANGMMPPQPGPFFMIGAILFLFGTPVASIALMLRLFQGGRLLLKRDGVEVHHRGVTVVCPWSLFNAEGTPFQPAKDRVLLPVDPAAVSLVEVRRADQAIGRGPRTQLKALHFKTANLLEIHGIFEVEPLELAELLVHLGRQLGTALPGRSTERWDEPEEEALESAPVLVRKRDGWLEASLVHLSFPPYCSDCGAYTAERKEFQGQATGFLEAGQSVPVEVPVCAACQKGHARAQQTGLVTGLFVGVLAGVVLALALGIMVKPRQAARAVFPLAIPLAVVGGVVGALIGAGAGKLRSSPVKLKDYSPSRGTVLIWFRNAAYGDALFEILGGEEEPTPPEPEEVGSVRQRGEES